MVEGKTERVKLALTPTLRREIQRIAERNDVSEAHVIRSAIRYYVSRETKTDREVER